MEVNWVSVNIPMRTLIDAPPKNLRPDSQDPLIYNDDGPGGWNRNREPSDYKEVEELWRKQDATSSKTKNLDEL